MTQICASRLSMASTSRQQTLDPLIYFCGLRLNPKNHHGGRHYEYQ